MRTLWLALEGVFACVGTALAQTGDCTEAAALVHADAGLSRAAPAIASRHELKVLVAGSASSILATKPSSGPSVTSTRGSARGSSDALTPRSSHVTARRKPARRAAVTVRLSTAPNGYARLSTVAPV